MQKRKTIYFARLFGWRIHIYKRLQTTTSSRRKAADNDDSDLRLRIDFDNGVPVDNTLIKE